MVVVPQIVDWYCPTWRPTPPLNNKQCSVSPGDISSSKTQDPRQNRDCRAAGPHRGPADSIESMWGTLQMPISVGSSYAPTPLRQLRLLAAQRAGYAVKLQVLGSNLDGDCPILPSGGLGADRCSICPLGPIVTPRYAPENLSATISSAPPIAQHPVGMGCCSFR